jgi:YVTN family beta-propeller protein
VSNLHDDTVVRVDPETFEVTDTIKVGEEPKELITKFGSVWVVNSKSNSVTRIDPRTKRVVGSPIAVGRNPIGIAATRGAIWVTNHGDDSVTAIKP